MSQRSAEQTRGCAGRRSSWKQLQEGESDGVRAPVPALCMTQESRLPSWWQQEGQSQGEQCDFSHSCAQHEAVGIELPTLNVQLRSQNLTLGLVHLHSLCFARSGRSSNSGN